MKLTMVSIRYKDVRYTGFIYLAPNATLTEDDIYKIVGHNVPRGSTYILGG